MFDHCQPIFINNLYGLLIINITDNSSCVQSRQWYFFYDYGYTLLIRFLHTAHLISNAIVFKIYSTRNEQKTLVFDSSNTTIVENDLQLDMKNENSGIWLELISMKKKKENIEQTSFMIDYVFRATSQSRFGREILQQDSSFNTSQPAFIALITIIAILVVAIAIAITILCCRYYSHRRNSKRRHKNRRIPIDQAHLAESNTPSSTSTYSLRSTQNFFTDRPIDTAPQTSSLGQSISTVPSMIPSRRLQQSMMDAYLNDFHSLQPNTIDPRQLNSYLFVDLHSTSSETVPDMSSKKYPNENTTTSGYDTSTGGEERNRPNSLRYRRRRRSHQHQRQRRRSTLAFKRTNAPRFLMRERSLPHTLIKLPQLRQQSNRLFNLNDNHSSTTTSNHNQDLISTNLSLTTDDYDENHAYHITQSRIMDTIDEEKPGIPHQPMFFEMVSVHRGDESDMPNYEDVPFPGQISRHLGDGIAYINDSIIV